jgi:hypothetical protein
MTAAMTLITLVHLILHRNILVEGETITAILDWEFAGWYPQYWEYTSAMGPAMACGDYLEWVPKFLEPDLQALIGMSSIVLT